MSKPRDRTVRIRTHEDFYLWFITEARRLRLDYWQLADLMREAYENSPHEKKPIPFTRQV